MPAGYGCGSEFSYLRTHQLPVDTTFLAYLVGMSKCETFKGLTLEFSGEFLIVFRTIYDRHLYGRYLCMFVFHAAPMFEMLFFRFKDTIPSKSHVLLV